MKIQRLNTDERISLAQALWDSVHESANDLAVTPGQQTVLEERLAALAADANPGDTWENVKRRIAGI